MVSKTPRIKKPKAENRIFLRKNFMKPLLAAIYYLSALPLPVFKHACFRSTCGMTSCKKTRANHGTQAFFAGIFAREPSHILWTGTLHNRFAWIIRNFAENLHKHSILNLYRHLYNADASIYVNLYANICATDASICMNLYTNPYLSIYVSIRANLCVDICANIS